MSEMKSRMRDAYEVLDNAEYHCAVGTTIHCEFDESSDRGFQLGHHVEVSDIEKRSDGRIRVRLGNGDVVSFYGHGGAQWNYADDGVEAVADQWAAIPMGVLADG